jgi:hypothetical protein
LTVLPVLLLLAVFLLEMTGNPAEDGTKYCTLSTAVTRHFTSNAAD